MSLLLLLALNADAKLVCQVKWCYISPDGDKYCNFSTEDECLKYLLLKREKGTGCELGNRCWICDQHIKCN